MKRAVLAVLPLVLLAGCAGRASVRRLDEQLTSVRGEVDTLEKRQDEAAREANQTAADLKAIDARLVELRAGLREATDEVQRLRGRVDGTEAALRAVRADVETLPARLAPPPPPPPPAPAKEVAARKEEGSAEEAFAKALATFRNREHGQAVLDFLDFIARYPNHPLTGQAQYWIAEAYYVQRDWRQAVVEFQKVLEQSSTAKAPDALLKIGLSYTKLHDGDRAREAWRRLVHEYPGTDAALRARPLLGSRNPVPAARPQ